MKIRNGFVSNSSSSSFCIYGVAIFGMEELYNKLCQHKKRQVVGCGHDFDREKCNFCPICGKSAWIDINICYYDELEDFFSTKYKLNCVDGNTYYTDDTIFIGRDLSQHSKIELEKLIELREKLKEMFPNETCEFFEGSSEGN